MIMMAMWMEHLREEIINPASEDAQRKLRDFLKRQGLRIDHPIEYTMEIVDGGDIAATGSFSGSVLKCIAVDEAYKNQGLSAQIVSHLVNEEYRRGRDHLFIYTKPLNKQIFKDLGFYPIMEESFKAVLLENRWDGVRQYQQDLLQESGDLVPSAAIVMNCNPFTLGHLHLIEYAAAVWEKVHLFVVWEDRSIFPSAARYRLVEEGVRHLDNVVLHKGKDYIISGATFPSYFFKNDEEAASTHISLDLKIFIQYIAPLLNIQKRYIGQETNCVLTRRYNTIMKKLLPSAGIDVEEIPRLLWEGEDISASAVRNYIRLGHMEKVKQLVPDTTYRFLLSGEAGEIIRRIRRMS